MRTSYGNGRARVGDYDLVLGPLVAPQSVTGVVFCHAQSHTAATMIAPKNGRPQAWNLMRTIAAEFPTIVSDQAGDSCANDNGLTAVSGCRTFLQGASSPIRAKAGKVLLVGVSMGFQVACAWARANPTLVAAIAGILPANNIDDIYSRNWNGMVAVVNAAYGGSYSTATYGATRDPTVFASQLTMPIAMWYASDDPGVLPATCTNFASIAPNVALHNIGAIGGHDTEASYSPTLAAGFMNFLEANKQ